MLLLLLSPSAACSELGRADNGVIIVLSVPFAEAHGYLLSVCQIPPDACHTIHIK
jgi:hypothetical protein